MIRRAVILLGACVLSGAISGLTIAWLWLHPVWALPVAVAIGAGLVWVLHVDGRGAPIERAMEGLRDARGRHPSARPLVRPVVLLRCDEGDEHCITCPGAPVVDDIDTHARLAHQPRALSPEDSSWWTAR